MRTDEAGGPRTIAHVITRFVRGGADENTLLSCNAQAAAGHDVVLIFGRDYRAEMLERLHPRIEQVCLPSMQRPIHPVRDAQALVALTRLFVQLKPDIVHTHTSKAGILGRLAAYVAGVEAVVHGVHILPFVNVGPVERAAYLALERLLDPLTDAFVSVSEDLRDKCVSEHVGAPLVHAVIPSGMDVERFRHAPPVSDAEISHVFQTESKPRLIVMAAALESRKRVVEFLDTFALVVKHRPDPVLAVLGEGIERLRALDRIEALGLSKNVRLLGFRDDIERWIAAADVCVLASEREGLPRTVVQYVLAARPVVVSALPGIEAIIADGENGFVTDGDDLEEMAAPILRLLNEPALAASFSSYSRRLNLSAWSVENMTSELEHVYARALEEPRSQPAYEGAPQWIS